MTCLSCTNDQQFTIIGGNTETITFDASNDFGNIANLDGCAAFFSFTPYESRFSDVAVRKSCVISESSRGSGVFDQIVATLEYSDTLSLSGKYTYQLTVKDPITKVVFCFQGTMIIKKNIDESAAKEV